jgi:4-hydroxythreonine-4-phosphate dehydrogenase
VIAVSVGCPAGIGPEVAVRAAAQASDVVPLLVGDPSALELARRAFARAVRLVPVRSRDEALALRAGELGYFMGATRLDAPAQPGVPSRAAGAAQLAWIDEALELTRAGVADAMTTGPVSKLTIASSGARGARGFLGHTEHLQKRLGAREVVMAFASERLTTSLVTTHLPLRRVARALTSRGVAAATFWLACLLRALGRSTQRLAVASLNPHAGEGGLLGDEEASVIAPGMRAASRRVRSWAASRGALELSLEGPLGAESAFRRAAAGELDGVVAMYHDQATIASKLLDFGHAVNVTLGLPFVRTSVDHGTAYDIAGRGAADPRA